MKRIAVIGALCATLYFYAGCSPVMIEMPNLVGLKEDEAISQIRLAGLAVGQVSEDHTDSFPSGHVIEQSPKEGSRVQAGASVEIVLSVPVGTYYNTYCFNSSPIKAYGQYEEYGYARKMTRDISGTGLVLAGKLNCTPGMIALRILNDGTPAWILREPEDTVTNTGTDDIALSADGSYWIAGGGADAQRCLHLTHLSQEGHILLSSTYELSAWGFCIDISYLGGVIVGGGESAGMTLSYNWPSITLLEYDEYGTELWKKKFSIQNLQWGQTEELLPYGHASAVRVGGDGNIFVIGTDWYEYDYVYSQIKISQNVGSYILCLDKDGRVMWRKVYPAAEIPNGYRMKEMFYDLQINDIGEVVVVGGDFSQDEERGFLMKLSPEGEDIWRKDYASPALYGLDIIPDEGYILCGDDLCLLRADINGDELWQHTMRGGINRSVWAVGNCYIACGSTTVNQGDISRTYMHCLRASDQGYAPRKPTLLTMDEVPPIFWNPPPFRKGLE